MTAHVAVAAMAGYRKSTALAPPHLTIAVIEGGWLADDSNQQGRGRPGDDWWPLEPLVLVLISRHEVLVPRASAICSMATASAGLTL